MATLLMAACLTFSISHAHAYCAGATSWTTQTVRVRIHADLHNQMWHQDATTWTRAELEGAVQLVLSRANESARGDTPWLYLDTQTTASSCTWLDSDCFTAPAEDLVATCGLANTIHIVPTNCGALYFLGSGTTQIIQVQSSNAQIALPAHARYGHHVAVSGAVTWAFEDILLHEIGHALGLNHPESCGWSTICPSGATGCAVMASETGPPADLFTMDDANGLESIYGARNAPVPRQWERILPATGFSTWTVGTVDATSYFGASSSAPNWADGTELTIVGYHRTADLPVAYSWNWSTFALTSLLVPNLAVTTGPLGASQSPTHRFVSSLTPRMSADGRRWRRRLTVSTRALASPSFWATAQTNPADGAIEDTTVAGVATARDPVSGFLVHAFRDNQGRVLLQGSNGTGSFSNIIQTLVYSMTQPQVACAGAGTTRNCMLTVVDPGNPISTATSQRLQWIDFSWSQTGATATWNPSSLSTTVFTPHTEHSLAVARRPDGTYEYSVAYGGGDGFSGSPGTIIYVIRRQLPSTSFLSMGFVIDEAGAQPSTAFGSVGTSFELFTQSRYRTP